MDAQLFNPIPFLSADLGKLVLAPSPTLETHGAKYLGLLERSSDLRAAGFSLNPRVPLPSAWVDQYCQRRRVPGVQWLSSIPLNDAEWRFVSQCLREIGRPSAVYIRSSGLQDATGNGEHSSVPASADRLSVGTALHQVVSSRKDDEPFAAMLEPLVATQINCHVPYSWSPNQVLMPTLSGSAYSFSAQKGGPLVRCIMGFSDELMRNPKFGFSLSPQESPSAQLTSGMQRTVRGFNANNSCMCDVAFSDLPRDILQGIDEVIERLFVSMGNLQTLCDGTPQYLEWAVGANGEIVVVQIAPIQITSYPIHHPLPTGFSVKSATCQEVIGSGEITGEIIYFVKDRDELEGLIEFNENMRQSREKYLLLVDPLVLTEYGLQLGYCSEASGLVEVKGLHQHYHGAVTGTSLLSHLGESLKTRTGIAAIVGQTIEEILDVRFSWGVSGQCLERKWILRGSEKTQEVLLALAPEES